MIRDLNLKGGIVTHDSFNIDLKKSLEGQEWELREDLAQIEYGDHYLIDIGFYEEGDPNGFFIIRVIFDEDWENPLVEKEVKRDRFLQALHECIDYVSRLYIAP